MKSGLPFNVLNNHNSWENVPRGPVAAAVGSVLGFSTATLFTVGGMSVSAASIAGFFATTLVTNWAVNALMPKPDLNGANFGRTLSNTVDGTAAQEFVYGKVRKGGTVVFYESSGSKNILNTLA